MIDDEELLLAVLNSSPVIDGAETDQLDGISGAELVTALGGQGSQAEVARLRQARAALHAAIRAEAIEGTRDGERTSVTGAMEELAELLAQAVQVPEVTPTGIRWMLRAPADDRLAVRSVLAWSAVVRQLPGRLRPCANEECNLFLVDHSRPGTAKWCSMATCGNRMKARAHAERARR
ncbi:CGNR zinc finger domain-containing protein [Agreia sp. COWG]|uniref:CGNR zinc finger domain-containing protein n=1 Tax=Agreia sp. COWG TaxID=2773266 RepID=UPI0019251DDC|nr:CGNR zinc finger domain-containing protein [Agreia sp. COWG]CAD6009985.1 zf-CGNR domain-containing protein [Agreia sp. COWG]